MSNIAIGNNNITDLKLGTNQVDLVVMGNELVWSKTPRLIDSRPAYHGYSLRRIKTTYFGFCLEVSRLAIISGFQTSCTANVAFDSNGTISLNSPITRTSGFATTCTNLGQFCKASGYTNADNIESTTVNIRITKWYDQSGNSKDVIQSIFENQPYIVISSVLQTSNGEVAIRFINTESNFLALDSQFDIPYNNLSTYIVMNATNTTSNLIGIGLGVALGASARFFFPRNTGIFYVNSTVRFPITSVANTDRLYELLCNSTTASAYSNSIQAGASVASVSNTSRYIRIGTNSDPELYLNGFIKEYIAFIGTPNRTEIENNINTYYTIW